MFFCTFRLVIHNTIDFFISFDKYIHRSLPAKAQHLTAAYLHSKKKLIVSDFV